MIPKVTVLMPVYNCRKYIEESVNSILNQTFTDFEFLIIDDCSTDGTREYLQALKDPRIRIITKTKNSGITSSLNMGLDAAQGEYIARMDGDDISQPHRFQKQVDLLDYEKDIILCGSWIRLTDKNKVVPYPSSPEEIEEMLFRKNAVAHPTAMLRRSVVAEHGLRYDPALEHSEDYDLWTRMAEFGKMKNIPEPLLIYRVHGNQAASIRKKEQRNNTIRINTRILQRLYSDEPSLNIYEDQDFNSHNAAEDKNKLIHFENEIEHLKRLNREKRIFNIRIFENHLETMRMLIIRKFFRYRVSYNWRILGLFAFNKRRYYSYFSSLEKIRVIVKCLLFKSTI